MTFFIKHFLNSILTLFVATALLGTTLSAKEPTQEERNAMAAKLIPIITMLLMEDTTAPKKPTLLAPVPSDVNTSIIQLHISGEAKTSVYINGVKVSTISPDGNVTLDFDLTAGDNVLQITLKDNNGNESKALIMHVKYQGIQDIALTPEVEILTEDIEKEIISIENNNSLVIKQEASKTWKQGDIKYISPSDNIESGMFLKIIDVKDDSNDTKKITYTTPTVDEVFKNLDIEMDANSSFKVSSVNMNKNVALKVNNFQLPKGAKGSLDVLRQGANSSMKRKKVTFDLTKGEGWNILKKLSATFDFPLYKSDDNHTTLTLNGKFELDDINITKFHFKTYHLGDELNIDNVFLNQITPLTGVDYEFGMEYTSTKEISLAGKYEHELSLAKISKDTLFECGLIGKKENSNGSITYTSSAYEESDICLGYVGIALGWDAKKHILVPGIDAGAGSSKSLLKLGIDLALIVGLDGKIRLAFTAGLKKKSYESFGGHVNTRKLIDDPTHFIGGYSIESASKGTNTPAKWIYSISGEISGEMEHYTGLAAAIHISNITPLGMRAYGGFKVSAKGEAYVKSTLGWGGCWDVGLDAIYGVDLISKNSLDINITNTHVTKWLDKINGKLGTDIDSSLTLGVNYKASLAGSPKTIARYNSCESDEYIASYIYSPVFVEDYGEGNIQIEYIGGGIIEPESVYYMLYDLDGNLVQKHDSLDFLNTLNEGDYKLKTVLVIDANKSIKTTLETNYSKTVVTPTPTPTPIPNTSTLKKTGQATSYYTGDDGTYQKGVTPSYSRANEVVTDNITGLQWQDDAEAKTVRKTWSEAQTYCSGLTLDGGGWRLPTIQELQSIVVDGAYNPSIDTTAFVNYTTSSNYWSSTTYANYSSFAWIVYFSNGYTDNYYKSNTSNVRCVR